MCACIHICVYVCCAFSFDIVYYSSLFLIASHNSEWLKLAAKSLTGEAVELKAKSSDTVATVKRQLQTKDDPSSWDLLLII